jgi:hypothetical protein
LGFRKQGHIVARRVPELRAGSLSRLVSARQSLPEWFVSRAKSLLAWE